MSQRSDGDIDQSITVSSLDAHVRRFHAALPPEEQALLARVFALAEQATEQDDTAGQMLWLMNLSASPVGRPQAIKASPALPIGDIHGASRDDHHAGQIELPR